VREAVGAEALHAAALVVHADQDVGPLAPDGAGQLDQRVAVHPMPGKENQAAGQRVLEAAAVVAAQGGAGDVEHDRGRRVHGRGSWVSTTTNAAA